MTKDSGTLLMFKFLFDTLSNLNFYLLLSIIFLTYIQVKIYIAYIVYFFIFLNKEMLFLLLILNISH